MPAGTCLCVARRAGAWSSWFRAWIFMRWCASSRRDTCVNKICRPSAKPGRYASDMDDHAARRAITPLRLIFWGGLLCIFDVSFTQTSNGQGFKCDVLNDVVGAVLIAAGVVRLSAIPVHDRYAAVMRVVRIVSFLAVLDAIREVFVTRWPAWVAFVAVS